MLRVVCFKKMRGVLLIPSIASHRIATAVVVVRSAKLRVEGVTDESANGNTYPSITSGQRSEGLARRLVDALTTVANGPVSSK